MHRIHKYIPNELFTHITFRNRAKLPYQADLQLNALRTDGANRNASYCYNKSAVCKTNVDVATNKHEVLGPE